MTWAKPENSKSAIDRAGCVIVSESSTPREFSEALAAVNNWRASHSFPLNTLQVYLRRRARAVDHSALVAQRIKRLSSIEAKLIRYPTMKISQMQDIGGCRAVMRNVAQVREVVDDFRSSSIKHKLMRVDDYLGQPQSSGYRGIHLIYRYFSDRNDIYNGLLIEIQVRSLLQHAWATAVETVGTFLKQSLKASQGHERWLRFFVVMASALAHREGTTLVRGTGSSRAEIRAELQQLAQELDVRRRLQAYGDTLRALGGERGSSGHYFLMTLEPQRNTITIDGYSRNELDAATSEYLRVERTLDAATGAEAVLVSVESIAALKRAYPNYFLDTKAFVSALDQALR